MATTPFDPTTLFSVVDLSGVVANGLLGGALARRMGFDLVGFAVLGIASGLGGGMIRDVLLGATPVVALSNPAYLTSALLSAAAAYLLVLGGTWTRRALVVADYLALGSWAATGALKAAGYGLGWLPAVLLGVVTAVGGGVVRDVLVGRTPGVFVRGPLYATLAVVGSLEALGGHALGHPLIGMGLSIATCFALGPIARVRGWTLPAAGEWQIPLSTEPLRQGLQQGVPQGIRRGVRRGLQHRHNHGTRTRRHR